MLKNRIVFFLSSWQYLWNFLLLQPGTCQNRGDACDSPGLPCTSDYKLVCSQSKTCDCRRYSKFFNSRCVGGRLFNACDDGNVPAGCSQFDGSVCTNNICYCQKDLKFDIKVRDKCATGGDFTTALTTCQTSDECKSQSANTCTNFVCSCPAGHMVSYVGGTQCDPIFNNDCTLFPVYERCSLIPSASCKVVQGNAICTCDAGYVPQDSVCVKSADAQKQDQTTDAKYGTPCRVAGAACNTQITLFCDSTMKCACQTGMVPPATAGGDCTSDGKPDPCNSYQVSVQGTCDKILGKSCAVAVVQQKCSSIANAKCTVAEGLVTPICLCGTGLQSSATGDSCVTATALPPGGLAKSSNTSSNSTYKDSSPASGGNTGIIIGVVVGLLLLLAAVALYFVLKSRKKPEEEVEEEEEGNEAESGASE